MNNCLPKMTERRRLFCLSPQKTWGRSGARRNKRAPPSGSECADSAAQEAPWHKRCGAWVSGEEAERASRRVGACNSSSELGGLKESLNVGSGSLSCIHDLSITCFPFWILQPSKLCICCHSEGTQHRQQMLAFICQRST